MSSPGKFEVFLLHPSLLENLMCSRNLFKKVAPGKKEQNSSPAALSVTSPLDTQTILLTFLGELHRC